jgi:D-apionolactonase
LSAVLDGADLRYVKAGDVEIVRRIYAAVRDREWNTIPGETLAYEFDDLGDSFSVRFTIRHSSHDLAFTWDGGIEGRPDGVLELSLDGAAEHEMLYSRIGFCVLHPYRETRGRPYRAQTPEGEIEGQFPRLIGPQRFEGGIYVPLFPSFDRLEIELEAGGRVHFEFEGDLWETEDHRNWTDASFKTYCTPMKLGFPHKLATGKRITQRVRLSSEGVPGAAETSAPALRVGGPLGRRLPRIGLGSASDGTPLSGGEITTIRALGLDHLRVDVHPILENWEEGLRRGLQEAEALGWSLEIALFLVDTVSLARVAELLEDAPVDRILVFVEGAQTATPNETTPGSLVDEVREHLSAVLSDTPIGGGTDYYFTELNRTRPEVERMDAISYSIIPQVHAFDDISLVETLEVQAETVESANALAGGKPVVVSPVTLRRRFNPFALGEEAEPNYNQLPDAVDPRQPSLLGAAWTVGSLKYLSEAGAASVTYYETAGWRGVVERESGSPLPELFSSQPGQMFPLYQVLTCAGEWSDAELLECSSTESLQVVGLAVARNGGISLLASNLQAEPLRVRTEALPWGATVRRLNQFSAPGWSEEQAIDDPTWLELGPYETVRLDG